MAPKKKNLDDLFSPKFSDFDSSLSSWGKTKGSNAWKCYCTHPALKLPGLEAVIYGGSCIDPVVTDADVYIGFDGGMRRTSKAWPWTTGYEFLYKIEDMAAPKDAESFRKLVGWTIDQLKAGQKVHCGCIGGHGRTGTFLAALCAELGEKDAITYVRDNYCHKAVESSTQVSFLAKNFGVKSVGSSKGYGSKDFGKVPAVYDFDMPGKIPAREYKPIVNNGSIWQPL